MPETSRPVVVVLYKDKLPVGMEPVEVAAEVRYARTEELAEALQGADVLFLWDFFSSALADVWEHADSLKWVQVAAAGVDKLLFDGLRESNVIVTNARGIFDRPIAEFVLGSILAFAKDIHGSVRRQERFEWEHRETERIDDQSVLIVGTGAIGREIARLLKAVGMRVSGAGRAARDGDPDFGVVHSSSGLVDAVGSADYLVNVAPLTDATRNLIDADVLAALKPEARLINVGRGESVDTDALVSALQRGKLAGAALDVFETEPLPANHPLWRMHNVLVSSHMSGDAKGWLERLSVQFTDNFAHYIGDGKLSNVVDKKLGFVPQ
ncbi:D-2-hydroxyacid dehydrogenase [Saxibacter everestensis]|uniref:D-2-hydroxyacid dehydrogenase n=1 Tax=Saxibacter everestensis TaxID=2909229 RepID=UPI0032E3603A